MFHKASANPEINQILCVSSIRSGKTHGLIYDALVSAWNNATPYPVLVCAPTYPLLGEVIIRPLKSLAQRLGLFKSYAGQGKYELVLKNGNIILFRSTDKPESLYGLTISKCYLDEAAFASKEAVAVLRDRLLTTRGKLVLTTTPAGVSNWVYEDYIEKKVRGCEYITYKIEYNPLVTPEAVALLRENMSELRARQQLEGCWVNQFEDLVYYSFSQENVTNDLPPETNNVIYIGLDYNLDKNAWIAIQKSVTELSVVDEGYGAHTTADVAEQIKARFPGRQIYVIPDATGSNRLQGVGIPNETILRQCGLNVLSSRQNPRRVLRYEVVNSWLLNAKRVRRLKIRPQCLRLIKELNTLTFKKGTDIPDDRSGTIGHVTDALGYALVYLSKSTNF